MSKGCTNKNQLDKCPSIETENSVISECFIQETPLGHRNGLVNGVVHEPSRVKKHKKGKKTSKKNDASDSVITFKSESEIRAQAETQEDGGRQENRHEPFCKNELVNSDNIDKPINKISKNNKKRSSNKIETLDSNDNISRTDLAEVTKLEQECTKSDTDLHYLDELAACEASCSKDFDLFNDIGPSSKEALQEVANNFEKLCINEEKTESKEEGAVSLETPEIKFVQYESELQMPMIMRIIQKDLSEPYSIYTYRYFIHNWPKLCFLAMHEDQCVGAIVCKLDLHRKEIRRGYIAMLAVDQNYRKLRIGSTLVQMAINEMIQGDADEVVLETEVTNKPALQLYEKLGFVRDKRLFRYYLNGVDALRLKLWLR